jgi:hypothetical protein
MLEINETTYGYVLRTELRGLLHIPDADKGPDAAYWWAQELLNRRAEDSSGTAKITMDATGNFRYGLLRPAEVCGEQRMELHMPNRAPLARWASERMGWQDPEAYEQAA